MLVSSAPIWACPSERFGKSANHVDISSSVKDKVSQHLRSTPFICNTKKKQTFEKILLQDLVDMHQQIILEGNFYSTFETGNGVLDHWESVNSDIRRLLDPFDFDLQFDKAIEKVGLRDQISSEDRHSVEIEYFNHLNYILSVKKKQDIIDARNKIIRKLSSGVIINMSDQKIPPELIEEFRDGKNFIRCLEDYGKEIDILKHRFLREEITGLLNRMYFWGSKSMVICPGINR